MSIADKFSWGGVEQQNDILGIHNLGHETGLVKFYNGLDDLPTMRESIQFGIFDAFDRLVGIPVADKSQNHVEVREIRVEPQGEGRPFNNSEINPHYDPNKLVKREYIDGKPLLRASMGNEDSGSGEDEGSSFTREDGKTRTTKDMNGRDITQVWKVGFLGGGTWKEVGTPTTPSRPVRNTGTSSSKPKPFMPTAEEKMLDHNWRENSDKMYELQNDQNILKEKSTKLTNALNELDTKLNKLKTRTKPTEADIKTIKRYEDDRIQLQSEIKKTAKYEKSIGYAILDRRNKQATIQEKQKLVAKKRADAGATPYEPTLTEQITGTTVTKNSDGTTSFRRIPDPETITPTQQQPVVERPESTMQRNKKKLGR